MMIQLLAGFVSAAAFAYLYNVRKGTFPTAVWWGSGLVHIPHLPAEMGRSWGYVLSWYSGRRTERDFSTSQKTACYNIPGPGGNTLVPGGKAYLTMLSFLQNDYAAGLSFWYLQYS